MAELEIKVEASGLTRALSDARGRLADQSPAWREIGEIVLESVRANFEAGGRPERWTPLSVESLAGASGSRKPLVRSGALERSISSQAGRDRVEIGSDLAYATAQFLGTATIPSRQPLVLQAQDEHAIAEVLSRYLTEPLR
jgi:phage gpG-like protein